MVIVSTIGRLTEVIESNNLLLPVLLLLSVLRAQEYCMSRQRSISSLAENS